MIEIIGMMDENCGEGVSFYLCSQRLPSYSSTEGQRKRYDIIRAETR
jgi:hypothetical protein